MNESNELNCEKKKEINVVFSMKLPRRKDATNISPSLSNYVKKATFEIAVKWLPRRAIMTYNE